MTQRSPLNERNVEDAKKGVARKSAASAKPRKEAASTVNLEPTKKTPKEKKMEKRQREARARQEQQKAAQKYSQPDTEEFRKWKRIWWMGLLAAVLFVLGSWVLRSIEPQWISLVILGFAYAAIIFAFWVDAAKIKKITRAYQEEMMEKERKANKGKSKKQIEEEEEAERARRKAEYEERLSKSAIGRYRLKRLKAAEAKRGARDKSGEETEKNAKGARDKNADETEKNAKGARDKNKEKEEN